LALSSPIDEIAPILHLDCEIGVRDKRVAGKPYRKKEDKSWPWTTKAS